MSENNRNNIEFLVNLIKVIFGVLTFTFFGLWLQNWETTREDVLINNDNPATNIYLIIPFFIGLITFATMALFQGIMPLLGVILQSARQNQN